MRLQTKLALFATGTTVGIIALFVWLLPYLMERIVYQNTNKTLQDQKRKVLAAIQKNGINFYLQGDLAYGSYSMLKDEYISIEPTTGIVKTDTLETAQRIIDTDTINYRILTYSFLINKDPYLLEIGKKTAAIKDASRALQKITFYILLALTIFMVLLHLLYTRYLLSPLGYIIRSRLLKNSFPFKEPPRALKTSTYDFNYLDHSITGLMQQVNNAFEKEKEFTSNASHELMTPISILQSKIENMLSETDLDPVLVPKLEDMMRTIRRLKKIVHSLLLISRIENDQYIRNDTVKPALLIQEVLEELQHRSEEKGLSVKVTLNTTMALMHLNRDLLFQLFYNIIHNSIRYNIPGGHIEITDKWLSGLNYTIIIKDSGLGMEPDQVEHIFDRFKRAQANNEGFGLGLSIVKSIATYQNIHIQVVSLKNAGSTFTITFDKKHLH